MPFGSNKQCGAEETPSRCFSRDHREKEETTMKRKHNGGYSLIEVLIAIAVLGIVTVPATSALITAHRVNVQAENMLTAQLEVSSAVETLMAEGINPRYDYQADADNKYPNVNIETSVKATDPTTGTELPYYNVTVKSNDPDLDSVFVETYIRAVETTPAGGG